MARKRQPTTVRKMRRRLDTPARSVMRAFRSAKFAAPRFMTACGIFPEVSEAASDRLHPIVHKLAVKDLQQARHFRALQRQLQRLTTNAGARKFNQGQLLEQIHDELTAVLAAEATAAYLFGLSVGLSVRSLPEQID
jgi:hypothetical protein